MARNLTPKQEKFVTEWFRTGNKSEAYRRAYSTENMTEQTINSRAYELSKHSQIRARFESLVDQQRKSAQTDKATAEEYYKLAIELAQEVRNPSAMTNATNGLVKLLALDTIAALQAQLLQNQLTGGEDEEEVEAVDIFIEDMSGGYSKAGNE